jgi:hypothetical protein
MTNQLSNVAVLTTSDVQRWRDGTGHTTGKLEYAISQGYDVYVVSTRDTVVPESDAWWMALVKPEHVFFADEGTGRTEEGWTTGWKRLFKKLGIDWPTKCAECGLVPEYCLEASSLDGDVCGDGVAPGTWMDARESLKLIGVRTGNLVRREMKGWSLPDAFRTNAR